jgi:phospholipid/cholesterol/gamma-HCH transport system substrate-binding protein
MTARIPRTRLAAVAAVALVVLLLAGVAVVVRSTVFGPRTITAYFTTTTAIYPSDEVRVSGVKVGNIKSIQPQGTQAKMTLEVDRDVPIPADAKAIIVASNLVSARYVQLSPAYRDSGPVMRDGAVIPVERTAVPVEWDEVKTQLMRLATDLGPKSGVSGTSVGRFIDSAANALDGGNGDKLRQTLGQLSGVARILANGSGNIVDIIKNLQTFVGALRDSNVQIVQFNDRLATLTSVVNDSKSDLDAALTDLSTAVGEVQRFIAGTRNQTSEQIARLADVTQNLVDHHMALENILHGAPNALGNFFNDYNADTGTIVGGFGLMNFANPTWGGQVLLGVPGCTQIGAIENVTAVESGKLCSLFIGPGLRLLNFNNSPIPINPFIAKSIDPGRVLYTEPRLAPGGEGPKPAAPEIPPAISAYTGLPGDPVGPPGSVPLERIPGAAMPLPPPPSTPMPPPPAPAFGASDMLLPADGPQQ